MIFNKSKLQNEHDIYYRIIVTVGKFAQFGIYNGTDRLYTMEGHELRNYNAKETLYYNEPTINSEFIFFSPSDLAKHNFECTVLFYFGGKQSPLMTSEYKLRIDNTNIYTKDTNTLITSMEENQYAFENSDKIKLSDKEKMKLNFGR